MTNTYWTLPGLFLLLLAACSASEQNDVVLPKPSDIPGLIASSLETMDDLDSYSMEITFSPEGEPFTTVADFAEPGDYRYIVRLSDDPNEVGELIEVGDLSYSRLCHNHPDDCEEWEQSERFPVPSLGGLTTFVPETLGFVTLELATDPTFIANEQFEGQTLFHLKASVNLSRAICDNQLRALLAAETQAVEAELASHEEECGQLNFEAVPPSAVDVWLFPTDFRIHHLRIGVPGDEMDPYLEIDYSRFNEISIEPPR